MAVLAGARRDRDDESHVSGARESTRPAARSSRTNCPRAWSACDSYLDIDNSGAPEGTFTSSLAAFDGTVAPPTGPGGTKYYDDNEWVGIELVRMYELTHSTAALGSAEAIMAFVMAGWDTDPEHVCPGGMPFSNSSENNERNTVTDGPGAELAVRLYQLTGNVAVPAVRGTGLQLGAHLPARAPTACTPTTSARTARSRATYWSYNQGSMIGAGVLLYQVTHNCAYLCQARQTAQVRRSPTTRPNGSARKFRSSLGLLPQHALSRLDHPRPARAEGSRSPTSTTPGSIFA